MYPDGRTSPIQERQMITVRAPHAQLALNCNCRPRQSGESNRVQNRVTSTESRRCLKSNLACAALISLLRPCPVAAFSAVISSAFGSRAAASKLVEPSQVLDANIHNIAIGGDFDDCQRIVKARPPRCARQLTMSAPPLTVSSSSKRSDAALTERCTKLSHAQ
eukprot:1121408-Pleurochrysis_carterae.AAC.2